MEGLHERQRITSLVLCICMLMIPLFAEFEGVTAYAADSGTKIGPSFSTLYINGTEGTDWKVLEKEGSYTLVILSDKALTLTGSCVAQMDEAPKKTYVDSRYSNFEGYISTFGSSGVTVLIASRNANLTLDGVTIDNGNNMSQDGGHVNSYFNNYYGKYFFEFGKKGNVPQPAIKVMDNCVLDLTVKGENTLKGYNGSTSSLSGRSAIEVDGNAGLKITSYSTGTLTANGGNGAAAIGSAYLISGFIWNENDQQYEVCTAENTGDVIRYQEYLPPSYSQDGGSIIIGGGTIEATSGENAAAIGSGYKGKGASVIIQGGIVRTSGGANGVGIGAGLNGSAVDITISSGIVEPLYNYNASSGIGARAIIHETDELPIRREGTINIYGGKVTAIGQPAIGSSGWYTDSNTGESNDVYSLTINISKTAEVNPIGYQSVGLGGSTDYVNIKGGVVRFENTLEYMTGYFDDTANVSMTGGILELIGLASYMTPPTKDEIETRLGGSENITGLIVYGTDNSGLGGTYNGVNCGARIYSGASSYVDVLESSSMKWAIPKDVTIYIPDDASLNVKQGTIVGDSTRGNVFDNYFYTLFGYVEGNGTWPGKVIEDIDDVPSIPSSDTVETMNDTNPTYLGIVESAISPYTKTIVSGNSPNEIKSKAGSGKVLTVLSAGNEGFSYDEIKCTYEPAADIFMVSLTGAGALKTLPINSENPAGSSLVIKESATEGITITGTNTTLRGPAYAVFVPKADGDTYTIKFENGICMSNSDLAFTVNIDPNKNDAVVTIPTIAGSGFELTEISPTRTGTKLRFGGNLSLKTPVVNIAGLKVKQLQLDYNGRTVMLGGIEANAGINIPTIAGMIGGSATADINTFSDGNNIAHFNFDVDVTTPVLSGEFELQFLKTRGYWLPNNLYMFIDTNPGLPLVPPTTVAYLKGGGLGVYGLAETIGMDSFGIPPIKMRATLSGSVVDVIEGKVDATIGPSGFSLALEDANIAGLEIIDSMGISGELSYGQRVVPGRGSTPYTGPDLSMGGSISMSMGNRLLKVAAGGELTLGAFTGIRTVQSETQALIEFYTSGELYGTLTVPKNALIKWIPPKAISIKAAANFYMGGSTYVTLASDASVRSAFEDALKNFAVNGSVSATVSANLCGVKAWLRFSYVFGGDFDVDIGKGNAPRTYSLSPSNINNMLFTAVEPIKTKDGNGVVITEAGGIILASSKYPIYDTGSMLMRIGSTVDDVVITEVLNSNEKSYTIASTSQRDCLIVMEYNESLAGTFDKSQFTVKDKNNNDVTLIEDEYSDTTDEYGGYELLREGNFTLSNDAQDENGNVVPVAYLRLPANTTYTVTNNAHAFDISVVEFSEFASLNESDTMLNSDNESIFYKIDNMETGKAYSVQVYLCENNPDNMDSVDDSGKSYLLAGTNKAEIAGSTSPSAISSTGSAISSNSGTLSLTDSGEDAPTGTYYLVVKLLEKLTTQTKEGESIDSWIVADTYTCSSGFNYENTAQAILEAPLNLSVDYAGNEALKANWDTVDGAEGYIITVYDDSGNETGVSYYVQGADNTEITMALTADSYDEDGNVNLGLSAGENYQISVAAYCYKALDGTNASENTDNKILAVGSESDKYSVYLSEAKNPSIYLPYGTVSEEGSNTLYFNPRDLDNGVYTFTVTASAADGRSIDSFITDVENQLLTGISVIKENNDFTVSIPEFEGSISLEFTAKDNMGDFTVRYLTITVNEGIPMLTLDKGGIFKGTITGTADANSNVYAWDATGKATRIVAKADGSFEINLSSAGNYVVQAIDKYNNCSQALSASVELIEHELEPTDPIESTTPIVWKNPFVDVKENDWFYASVKNAFEKNLIKGITDNTFEPYANVTRAMFVTVLYRLDGELALEASVSFDDMKSGEYYEKAVAWANTNGVVRGVSDTEFAPDTPITREQMAVIFYRYAMLKGIDVSVDADENILVFSDKDKISEFAISAIQWAVRVGIMQGNTDGSFAPLNNATRAEMTVVFERLQNIIK